MVNVIKKVISRVFDKNRKFFPMVNEKGIAEKPRKFFPMTEREYILAQRRKGLYGNGHCVDD